jgi:hypothetical protein
MIDYLCALFGVNYFKIDVDASFDNTYDCKGTREKASKQKKHLVI